MALHRARCSLCASPNKERYESDLVAGGDLDRIRRALNAEIRIKTGKSGTVSRRAIVKHQQLLPYFEPSRSRAETAPVRELSDVEVSTPPLSPQEQLKFRIFAACLTIVGRVERSVMEASEGTSLYELAQSMRELVNVGLMLPDKPASETKEPRSTLAELAELITDPDDREAFIEQQRNLQRNLKESIRIARKYEKPPVDASASEDDKPTT